MKKDNEENRHELDEIEEKLVGEHLKSKKTPMAISGKSVFEIKRIKEDNHKDNRSTRSTD